MSKKALEKGFHRASKKRNKLFEIDISLILLNLKSNKPVKYAKMLSTRIIILFNL